MQKLEEVIDAIEHGGIRGDIWLDGSFLTEKLNPDDVDVLLSVTSEEYRAMDDNQRAFFDWFRNTSLYENYKCDNYGIILDPGVAEFET